MHNIKNTKLFSEWSYLRSMNKEIRILNKITDEATPTHTNQWVSFDITNSPTQHWTHMIEWPEGSKEADILCQVGQEPEMMDAQGQHPDDDKNNEPHYSKAQD